MYAMGEPNELRRQTKSLAVLDAILSPEWQYRYYSYNATWRHGEEMASMRDGGGDGWFLHFSRAGVALKGFSRESLLAGDREFSEQIRRQVPASFGSFLDEAAFSIDEATFCAWRAASNAYWTWVSHDGLEQTADGSATLLAMLDGNPQTYRAWAAGYYEIDANEAAVAAIYAHAPLDAALIASLNPASSLDLLAGDLLEIGYPVA